MQISSPLLRASSRGHPVRRRGQQAVDRLGLDAGEILLGDLAGGVRLFGLLQLAPDRGRVMQLLFGVIVKHLPELDDSAERHEREAEKQGERVHVSPPAGLVRRSGMRPLTTAGAASQSAWTAWPALV